MSTEYFYSQLPVLADFLEITNFRNFVSVPPDWQILVTDVIASTKAIESGRYKEVNLIGATSIVAILNIAKDIELPFVFGGDGASILIPPSLVNQAKLALLATQNLAKQAFQLDLRIGIVPVSAVNNHKYQVQIAKLKVSENYHQAVFTGYGLTQATELVKNPDRDIYQIKNNHPLTEADFSGLECRWQDIPSSKGEIVSLLVMATASKITEANYIYRQVLEKITEIYGEDTDLHPISASNLHLTLNEKALWKETKIRAFRRNWLDQQLYLSKIKWETYLGILFLNFKPKIGEVDWGKYKDILLQSTDYKKFDDILRMVIAGNDRQRQRLTSYLETQYQAGKLVYGIHTSDRALMTCLVFERSGRQVHFIDGADGGYALAAKGMKKQIQGLSLKLNSK